MGKLKFLCPNCNYEVENELDENNCCHCDYCEEDIPEDDIIIFESDDNMPECCSACGCSSYPKCKTSCKIFDD